MPDFDRVVAGLRCREVLGGLSDYLDGLLPAALVSQVDAHLAACPTCARFGSDVGTILAALRAGEPPGESLTEESARPPASADRGARSDRRPSG